jgi:nitrite reductase/ring-hydroxylating ferredoxin subunit
MSLFEDRSRRRFIKSFVLGTASAIVAGQPWRGAFLAQAAAPPDPDVGILKVRLSDYPSLLNEFGSVRLGFNPIDTATWYPGGFFYPILINRGLGNEFYALDTYCHHEGCVVPPYDSFDNKIVCPCHGSEYAIDGTLLGGLSSGPLDRLNLTYDGDETLTIEVPRLGYSVTAVPIQTTTPPKLLLDFPTKEYVEYEVQFRQRMQDSWTVVPFSRSLDGPEDSLSLIADPFDPSSYPNASVYVSRTRATGFYAVSVKVLNLTEI